MLKTDSFNLWPAAFLAAALWSPFACAQYKCVVNGKTVYADAPCAANAKHVGELQDRLTEEQQVQRLQQSIKERKERNRIEGQQDAAFESQQRSMQRQASAEQSQARADESIKHRRCAGLQRDMDYNKQGVARYQDFGWQRSLTEQENQLKRNREAYDRECR